MHTPYEQMLGHKADFKVRYRFYAPNEGGRKTFPHQGYRSDFWYDHPENTLSTIFMIWPEFENEDGTICLDNSVPVQLSGIATMWVIIPQRRTYHADEIKVGLKGYFMEGSRRVAECEVIEMLDLLINPRKK